LEKNKEIKNGVLASVVEFRKTLSFGFILYCTRFPTLLAGPVVCTFVPENRMKAV
jgi:hypothetical protein